VILLTSEEYIEEVEDEEDYGEEVAATDALNTYPESRVPFSREDLVNAESLRTSDFLGKAIDIIENSPFTMEYKQALARWGQRSFNKDIILSDTSARKIGRFTERSPYETVLLSAKLDLVKTRLSRSRSDTREPAAHTIEDDLIFVFIALLSRTYGVKRERLINSLIKMESESIQRTGAIEQPDTTQNKNKGWFSRK